MKNLGNIITDFMNDHDLSTRDFAKLAGISHTYVSKLQSGVDPRSGKPIEPTLDVFQKLATAMNMTLDSLLKKMELIHGNEEVKSESKQIVALNKRDEKDIAKDVDKIMSKLDEQEDGPIYYNGKELSEVDRELFKGALELALKSIKIKNKEKYTPKKYKR